MEDKTIFAFDVGKSSLGICVRKGNEIIDLKSLLIDAEYANVKHLRDRRRSSRTRDNHKSREQWLKKIWIDCGLIPLDSNNPRMLREFPKTGDETIYNSSLLRVALLSGKDLEEWQIYKALHSAIQRRGYDIITQLKKR